MTPCSVVTNDSQDGGEEIHSSDKVPEVRLSDLRSPRVMLRVSRGLSSRQGRGAEEARCFGPNGYPRASPRSSPPCPALTPLHRPPGAALGHRVSRAPGLSARDSQSPARGALERPGTHSPRRRAGPVPEPPGRPSKFHGRGPGEVGSTVSHATHPASPRAPPKAPRPVPLARAGRRSREGPAAPSPLRPAGALEALFLSVFQNRRSPKGPQIEL